MSARSKARKQALDLLYEADVRGLDAIALMRSRDLMAEGETDSVALREYAGVLVAGVCAHRQRIDDVIATYSLGWDLDRMPVVDRNLLRIAVYEILYETAVDVAVVIDEAVEAAKTLSTDESATYLNGVLAPIAALR